MVSIPMQTTIVVPIKEMYLATGCPNEWMQTNELEQCTCATFFHTNYKHFGQMTIELFTLFAEQTIFWRNIDFIQSGQRNISHNNRIN